MQEKVDRGTIRIKKVDGEKNVADLLTKYLSGPRLQALLASLPVIALEGRHPLAPQLQGALQSVCVPRRDSCVCLSYNSMRGAQHGYTVCAAASG